MLRQVSTSVCAAALLVPALLSQHHQTDAQLAAHARPVHAGPVHSSPVHGSPVHSRPGHGRPVTAGTATQVLDVNYESGTADSGIPGLTTTHATAPDASSIVQPGYRSRYAAQFKVTLGDPGYVSDGAPRSEDATDQLPNGIFHVGDTQRYDISILLKDWQPYQAGDSDTGDIIFQGKYGGAQPPAFYLMTKRNAIAFRSPNLNLQTTVVPDFRPYINQWLNFQVDAHWATDTTGYFTVSVQLPGQCGYTQMVSWQNVATWDPRSTADDGYLKWGLYRPSESLANGDVPTRIVQDDNIRIFNLS